MDKEEMLMLTMFIVSYILAVFITWRIWPHIKKKMERSRWGRLLLDAQGIHGSRFHFFVCTLVWGAVLFFMFLIWAFFTS